MKLTRQIKMVMQICLPCQRIACEFCLISFLCKEFKEGNRISFPCGEYSQCTAASLMNLIVEVLEILKRKRWSWKRGRCWRLISTRRRNGRNGRNGSGLEQVRVSLRHSLCFPRSFLLSTASTWKAAFLLVRRGESQLV